MGPNQDKMLPGGIGTPLHHWDDTGWLKRARHLSPADSFLGNNLQGTHMSAPKEKRKHLTTISSIFFPFFLAVFEELGTNSPVADLKDVCPKEILSPTAEISHVLQRTSAGRKPAFVFLSFLLIFRVSFMILLQRNLGG